MKYIYAEKVLEASLEEVFDEWCCDCDRDTCPVMRKLYTRLEAIKQKNNDTVRERIER